MFDQTLKVIKLIHQNNGFVFLLMSDNLFFNEQERKIKHLLVTILNEVFKSICLYDPLHLLKNRSNWQTEKSKHWSLKTPKSNKQSSKRSNLIHIYKLENDSFDKLTRSNYTTLPLSNFEKKKAYLAINIFSEKTIGALEINDKKDAAVFVSAIT